MATWPLLVEIRTEELPPKLLITLATNIGAALYAGVQKAGLTNTENYSGDTLSSPYAPQALAEIASGRLAPGHHTFATPRRLATIIHAVHERSPERSVVRRGPAHKHAYTAADTPSKALTGFLRANQATQADVTTIEHKGASYVALTRTIGDQPMIELLGTIIDRVLASTVAPRMMRWGSGKLRFVRPIHGIYVVHGNTTVSIPVLGQSSAPHTVGHRFLAPQPIAIATADEYATTLAQHDVIVDPQDRWNDICNQARALEPDVVLDDELLAETVAMCERPFCLACSFEQRFLYLPDLVVSGCMQQHLKSFPVVTDDQLVPRFVFVADNKPANLTLLTNGLERVMRARLDDAMFIYEQDLLFSDQQLLAQLDQINYIQGLGSMRQRCNRIRTLAKQFAKLLGLDSPACDLALEAATLCKADLGTQMIAEYPELEGHMAAHYLQEVSEQARKLIARLPLRDLDAQAGDRARDALVIASELERLVAIAVMFKVPTGAGDPHALRRSLLRIIRILVRYPQVDFNKLLHLSITVCSAAATPAANDRFAKAWHTYRELQLMALDRLANQSAYLLNLEEAPARITLNAVLAPMYDAGKQPATEQTAADDPPFVFADLAQRITAIEQFKRDQPRNMAALLAVGKRLVNITATDSAPVDPNLFNTDAEHRLYTACQTTSRTTQRYEQDGNYLAALGKLAELRPLVDNFFADVLVNAEDPDLRRNRQALVFAAATLINSIVPTQSLSK